MDKSSRKMSAQSVLSRNADTLRHPETSYNLTITGMTTPYARTEPDLSAIRSFPAREFAGRDLKSRCLDAAAGFAENIADAVASALVFAGPSASARAVEEYAAFGLRDKPRSRDAADRLPDNPGWQAELLTISELSYAYNAGTITSGEASGIYAGSRWMLSPLHKQVDICDEYATEDKFGLGAGVFPRGQEPCYPHPNCRCWLAPVFGNAKEGR